jgi:hypothetical protein
LILNAQRIVLVAAYTCRFPEIRKQESGCKMSFSLGRVRWRRVIGAAFAVMALSFLVPIVIVSVYAFVLAFQARGAPDQTAIHHFAAGISPKLMPWLETVLTFLFAVRVARKADEQAGIASGVILGILAGLLSSAVTLAFGGRMGLHSSLFLLAVVTIGCLGGFIGQTALKAKYRKQAY